jgi:hypothetical protein
MDQGDDVSARGIVWVRDLLLEHGVGHVWRSGKGVWRRAGGLPPHHLAVRGGLGRGTV